MGAERIRGELLKLGIHVCQRTIQKYIRPSRPPLSSWQGWATFLHNHAADVWSCDFLQVTDLFFRPLFAFFIIELQSRRVIQVEVTRSPSDSWVAQQLREATPYGQVPKESLLNKLTRWMRSAILRSMEQDNRREKYQQMRQLLNEKQWRQFLALEAKERGNIVLVAREAKASKNTIKAGRQELEAGEPFTPGKRIRGEGGGRKKQEEHDPSRQADLEGLLDPKGDPMSLVRWTTKSVAKLKEALKQQGYQLGDTAISKRLHAMGYSLRANKKTIEGSSNVDRDAQFGHIKQQCEQFEAAGDPIISVDCKKKELIGNFKNNGREWQAKGEETRVTVYDYLSLADGKAVPYGVYNLIQNQGFVNVGIDHDTAEFAVESVRRWWNQHGRSLYPEQTSLLITADGGGSNGARSRLWKREMQRLANETGRCISVCHFPPGTSKWNEIEHRLFSYISINWRAKPLVSLETVIELISHTTTQEGLVVTAMKDSNTYPTGIKVSDDALKALRITRDDFHGEWNYTFKPLDSASDGHVI